MLHLRSLNPYVASSLAAAKADASKAAAAAGSGMSHAGGFSATRQPAAVPAYSLGGDIHSSNSSAAGAIGISAFAFQGTNAHMLVAAMAGGSTAPEPQHPNPAVWQLRRYWYVPKPSALLVVVAATGGSGNATVAFTLQLRAPGLAYLHDHQVCFYFVSGICHALSTIDVHSHAVRSKSSIAAGSAMISIFRICKL
jgi:hypothetical protein